VSKLGQYIYNNALAIDQYLNAVLLGDPDESISGRTGRAIASGKPKWWVKPFGWFLDKLFEVLFNEKDHVLNAIEPEELVDKELWSWIKGEG
jgi:hypothetical protein